MQRFYDVHGAKQRVDNSVIRYEGNPIYVNEARARNPERYRTGGAIELSCNVLKTGNALTIDAEDLLIDISSPPIGYLNNPTSWSQYLVRVPHRRWKSGVSTRNIIAHSVSRGASHISNSQLRSLEMHNTILNLYPSIDEAKEFLDRISTEHGLNLSRAFSRHVAIGRVNSNAYKVEYKGIEVGKLMKNSLILNKNYEYLEEYMHSKNLTSGRS